MLWGSSCIFLSVLPSSLLSLSLTPAPIRSGDISANEIQASSVGTCFHLWWGYRERGGGRESKGRKGEVEERGREDLTAPSHPAVVLSAHGFCGHVCKARKDGLPAHRLTKPFVFCWTVCCIVRGAWLKGDCQSPLIYLFHPSCRVKEPQLQNTFPRGFFFCLFPS